MLSQLACIAENYFQAQGSGRGSAAVRSTAKTKFVRA